LTHLRDGGPSLTLNCGYGHGFSVREVIAAVKRVSGVEFKVENAARRPGDPAQLVADTAKLCKTLHWQPRYDDLPTLVAHALAWERKLMRRRAAAPRAPVAHLT
jgi:UDP-glucose 4-epimerase